LQAFTSEVDSRDFRIISKPLSEYDSLLITATQRVRVVTSSTLIAASDVPYATGRRKLEDMMRVRGGSRPRKSGKTFFTTPERVWTTGTVLLMLSLNTGSIWVPQR
jgi:hypothetical protein